MPTAVPLPQLVDLALGSPEVGAVNFNVLHTLLHAMIKKLGLADAKADLSDADKEFLSTGVPQYGHAKSAGSALDDKESNRGDDSVLDESVLSEYSAPGKPSDGYSSVPYHKLENRVAELTRALQDLNALPNTQDFFGEGHGYRVPDMWQSMQLKKRVDANEEGVGKVFFYVIN
jgi:hypothetical protein